MTSTIHSHLRPGTGLPSFSSKMSGSAASPVNNGDRSTLGFGDLIDIVNPLQHVPVIGHIYRSITGDTIQPMMKIAGGALFGGPLGAMFSAVEVAFTTRPEEPAIPAGGVDPATVANTWPFAESNPSSLTPDSTPLSPSSKQHYGHGDSMMNPVVKHTLVSGSAPGVGSASLALQHLRGGGIPNPAAIKQYEVSSDSLVFSRKPAVDVLIGVKKDAG